MRTARPAKPAPPVPDWLCLLAAAVVQQAQSDAFDQTLPPSVRLEARRFLAGDFDYRLWGHMAEGRVNGFGTGRRSQRVGAA